jgi:hypothetical protein
MRRLSRTLTAVALIGFVVGIASWRLTRAIAIPSLIVAPTAVLGALFSWFRFDELRELDRLGQ